MDALQRSMELSSGGNSCEWFLPAMAHWQPGQKDEARQRYRQAVEWMEKHQPANNELLSYRREAAELVGIPVPLAMR